MNTTNHGENKNIENISKIDTKNIDISMYFLSLTDNALNAGLLTGRDMETMQSQIYDILSDSIWMYTNGSSTSVTSLEANELLLAVLAVLDCFCISYISETSETELDAKLIELTGLLKERGGVRNCYNKGLKLIDKMLAEAKILANKTFLSKISINFELYIETIHIEKFKSVLYVKRYLEFINSENKFCAKCIDYFGKTEINTLIQIYSHNNLTNDRELMDNIFAVIFANVFFSFMTDLHKERKLVLNHAEFEKIAKNIYIADDADLYKSINKTKLNLFLTLKINGEDLELKKYVSDYTNIFVKNLLKAVKSRQFDKFITIN
ncbi:MAG: DUF6179 domain-containing protein [Oscillospiraceae bacterium]|nr:DUF6179 domain-containing protein [Oscillospiraceae bacterium]